ncbi:hypothetical protein [Neorhizobium sp. DT-125]|uniref:hypothetical protein n=1 Tax=Neorhizobium sp. DT-125 TaxID=3396163 RepID=UPI003F197451
MKNFIKEPVADLVARLEPMTQDEVFAMSDLEAMSEGAEGTEREEALSQIALIEEEIEKRFPGQLLAPYREWKRSEALP